MIKSAMQDVMLPIFETQESRKECPIVTGVLDYFPAAMAEIARVSLAGHKQHNLDGPLRWARDKSTDQINTALRHIIERGTRDTDGVRHLAKAAWRILAALQEECERDAGFKTKGQDDSRKLPCSDRELSWRPPNIKLGEYVTLACYGKRYSGFFQGFELPDTIKLRPWWIAGQRDMEAPASTGFFQKATNVRNVLFEKL